MNKLNRSVLKEGDFSNLDKKELFEEFLSFLENRERFGAEEIPSEIKLPVNIFVKKLGSLESIVKYLKENRGLSYKKIAELLYRNRGSINVSYLASSKKMSTKFSEEECKNFVPISVFKNKKLSVLETIVIYLKDHYESSYHEVAILIHRDDRTVWTVYQRGKKKK